MDRKLLLTLIASAGLSLASAAVALADARRREPTQHHDRHHRECTERSPA